MEDKNPLPPSHNVTTPNKRPATPLETLKIDMERELSKQVANYFNNREEQKLRFMTASVDYVRQIPKLLECDRNSLMTALLKVAFFRFMPSGVSGEAYIIPYGSEAKMQIGYQGIVTLLFRTDKIVGITANIVYENDEFDFQEGLDAHLKHKPVWGKPKGKPIGVYTVVEMKGGSKTFKVMSEEDVMEIKELSKAKNTKESPWNSDRDPLLWMWKKTCLIQHSKLLPKTDDLNKALEADFEGEGLKGAGLDAGGAAVPKSFHDPAANAPEQKKDVVDGEVVSEKVAKEKSFAAEVSELEE